MYDNKTFISVKEIQETLQYATYIRVIQSQSLMVSCDKYKPQKAVRFSTLLQK